MTCIKLLGCLHPQHHSAKDYTLMALMVVAILFGLRILTYIIARCVISRRQPPESRAFANHEFEMRVASAALTTHRNQEWRRQAVEATKVPSSADGEWQSKLVIAAGCDRVSYIAHPRPFTAEGRFLGFIASRIPTITYTAMALSGPSSGVSTLAFVARTSAFTFGFVYGSVKLSYLLAKAKSQ